MNIKGVIFDLDGTLLNSEWVWNRVDELFLGKRGIEVPKDYVETISPMGFNACAIYTIERFGLNETPEAIMKEWTDMAYMEYRNNVTIYPGVKDFLMELKKHSILMGIATANHEDLFVPCLKNNGIDSFFHSYTTIPEVGCGKESPDIYIHAAAKMGLSPDECAVFEDLPGGIKAAKLAGFSTVGIKGPLMEKNKKMMYKYADIIIDGFTEIDIKKYYSYAKHN